MSSGNHVIHAEVTAEECNGDIDRMLKKFSKRLKRDGMIEEYFSRRFFVAPSEIRNAQKRSIKRRVYLAKKYKDPKREY